MERSPITNNDSNVGQEENTHPNIIIDHNSSSPKSNISRGKLNKKKNNTPSKSKSKSKSNAIVASTAVATAAAEDTTSVKVVVRIRPVNRREREGVRIVQNLSSHSLSIQDHRTFHFHTVFAPDSSQDDIFKSVGIPLVTDTLAGFNTSLLSYGQTGSGKTYTMWGPPSAMLDCHSINSYQGIVPRIFHLLFSEIHNMQMRSEEKQLSYQCRCSFLEIYNEQINDLLDPTQRNLQIRNDARNGLHVENLTDEYVTTVEDVTQILVKGLSNRKVGATSMNSKSSRSHIMLTCTIESWCKGPSLKCFSNSRTSRISLVDLAGFDRDKIDGVGRHIIKERKYVKKSLSKLGKVVNYLAETACSGKEPEIPCVNSCLALLLQDTLGGNSKTTIICAISPNDRHRAGTLSTLRFGEKAKLVQNNAVINGITEEDVNGLSDQIRQLKDELIQTESSGRSREIVGAYFRGKSARDSLNILRVSLNRSLILPRINDDSEEELDVNEDVVIKLCSKLSNLCSSLEDKPRNIKERKYSHAKIENGLDSLQGACADDVPIPVMNDFQTDSPRNLVVPSFQLPLPQDPTICISPKIENNNSKLRKSITVSSSFATANNASVGSSEIDLEMEHNIKCGSVRSSLQQSKICPTEYLAASLQRGLQIIDYHQQTSAAKRSPLGLSFDHFTSYARKKVVEEKVKVCPKTLCSDCKKELNVASSDVETPQTLNRGPLKGSSDGVTSNFTNEQESNGSMSSTVDYVISENHDTTTSDRKEKEALLIEIENLKNQLKSSSSCNSNTVDNSLLDQIRNGSDDYEKEKHKWTESESLWISLAEELRLELELTRRIAEKKDIELNLEKKCTTELDDALQRSIMGHTKMIEHYVELQEEHNELVGRHRKIMKCIEEVKKAAAKASSKKGITSDKAFAAALAKEMTSLRVERERERDFLKEQNKILRTQLRDTAEAVNAAGEILVRLREAEESCSLTEKKYVQTQQENEKLRKQVEKMKRKHKMEIEAMKHYLAESRLPGSALEPIFHHNHHEEPETAEEAEAATLPGDDDQSWRAAFTPYD